MYLSTMSKTAEAFIKTIVCKGLHNLINLVAEYVVGLVPMGTHDWNLYMNPENVIEIMNSAGYREVNKSGIVMTNIITKELEEHPTNLRVNYQILFKRLIWVNMYIQVI